MMGMARTVIKLFPVLRKTLSKPRVAAVRHAIDTGESRWKLLKTLKGGGDTITPADWKILAGYLKQSEIPGPQGLMRASYESVTDGFAGWWNRGRL
jgi:hypothetical protein